MNVFLFGVLPYLSALLLIGGLWYRYRFDQFGWTSRSSQMYEGTILKVASPVFHFALLGILAGHIIGLFIPKAWTDAIGITQRVYHLFAVGIGGLAGVLCIGALVVLIWRRRTNARVFAATTANDKMMYVILGATLVFGMVATLFGGQDSAGHEVNYRETVSVWFRSLFIFQPDIDAMAAATTPFKVHVIVALVLFAILPLTRLVHAFAVPLQYLFRPYVVYRSRGQVGGSDGSGRPTNSWQTLGGKRNN